MAWTHLDTLHSPLHVFVYRDRPDRLHQTLHFLVNDLDLRDDPNVSKSTEPSEIVAKCAIVGKCVSVCKPKTFAT